jgi:hypothetical protein
MIGQRPIFFGGFGNVPSKTEASGKKKNAQQDGASKNVENEEKERI